MSDRPAISSAESPKDENSHDEFYAPWCCPLLVSIPVAHSIGLNEAVFLSALHGRYEFLHSVTSPGYSASSTPPEYARLIDHEGWVCYTEMERQRDTTLTVDQQRPVIKRLVKHGIIMAERRGCPYKQWFKIKNYGSNLYPSLLGVAHE